MATCDMTGKKIGKLYIISIAPSKDYKKRWHCKCECGKEVIVRDDAFKKTNPTESCGCINIGGLRHGQAKTKQNTKTYSAWIAMRSRCNTPNNVGYKHYGERGIKVCDRWNIFENFLADMGEKPEGMSTERIDNNGNYEPGNCRWATKTEQNRNKRDCHYVTYKGRTKTITEWAEETGISRACLYHRFNVGWEAEKAFNTPSERSK